MRNSGGERKMLTVISSTIPKGPPEKTSYTTTDEKLQERNDKDTKSEGETTEKSGHGGEA